MIHWSNLLRIVGVLVTALAVSMGLVAIFAFFTNDPEFNVFLLTSLLTLGLGLFLSLFPRTSTRELSQREGLLLVVGIWVSIAFLGSFPFYFSGLFPSFTDSFFESISGFTTTGATVLEEVEVLPGSLLLWRSLTQWLGGMGIILLAVAILPLIGVGGMELYRAEFSGSNSEKLTPRVAETALSLWKLYLAFTLAGYVALRWAGMDPLSALCHAFSTMATGGFSTRNASIESFQNPLIEYVIIGFMIIAGINFTRHYKLLVEFQPRHFFRDTELRLYFLLIVIATGAIVLLSTPSSGTVSDNIRVALFQVVSILTTTGFSSANFELWGPFAQLLLLALMFVGGCTGSTAGGLKIGRISLLFRVVSREFRRMAEPRGIFAVRLDREAVAESTIQSFLNLVYLAFIINFAGCITLTALGVDILTSITAVTASMFNIGPGLGQVGPTDNFGHLPALAKWVLSFCMLAGRLEYYAVLLLFTKAFWRK